MLDAIGLSADAEAVYLAMLANPHLDVLELAAHMNLPVEAVRATLDELIDLALVSGGSDGTQLRPIGPTVGLTSLVARAEAEMAEKQQQLEATRNAVMSLAAAHDSARAREQITKWIGLDAVRGRIDELCAATTMECVSLHPSVTQTPDAKSASRPVNQRMLERGASVRGVYQDSHRFNPVLLEYANWLTDRGGEIRTAPAVPMLLIVFDHRIALLPLDPADTRQGAQEVHAPGMVAAAHGLFTQIWSTAVPTGQPPEPDGAGLDPRQRTFLNLLAAGSTEEMIARQLGVSLRTVKRKSAELMDLLGARSRFEAGVLAAQRGWVDLSNRRGRQVATISNARLATRRATVQASGSGEN